MAYDVSGLGRWLGEKETAIDYVTVPTVHRLSALLDRDDPFPRIGDPLPIGWHAVLSAGLGEQTRLITEPSSIALPRLVADGVVADAAFVDGSHRFHEVFVDLYFLRKLVRPGGLIILDDTEWPSVATALRYYDVNLDWQPVHIGGRLAGRRMPDVNHEPPFSEFKLF